MSAYSKALRHEFFVALGLGLKVVWPVLSGLIGTVIALGITIGILEGWPVFDSIYFSLITALTIGYGDFAPKLDITRLLAILIGVCGLLLTATVAAVGVKALTTALEKENIEID
jgi:hypothetical protein